MVGSERLLELFSRQSSREPIPCSAWASMIGSEQEEAIRSPRHWVGQGKILNSFHMILIWMYRGKVLVGSVLRGRTYALWKEGSSMSQVVSMSQVNEVGF